MKLDPDDEFLVDEHFDDFALLIAEVPRDPDALRARTSVALQDVESEMRVRRLHAELGSVGPLPVPPMQGRSAHPTGFRGPNS